MMNIHDRIYGELVIDEPVITELIASHPMQRLKEISQDGAVHFIQPIRNVTRYEHSIGTWYLSSLFKRPIEEQIASLLHDIPHTAFSHVIDFVVNDPDQGYHDQFTKQVIMQSDIPAICLRHGIDIEKVLKKEDFYLLDNSLPDISVDRWDYFMRDGFTFGLLPQQTIDLFLHSMKEKRERFYFEDTSIARLFAIMFLNCCRLIWLDPISHGSFFLLAEALKLGIQKKMITEKDFFQTDDYVMHKLKSAHYPPIDALLDRLQPGEHFVYASQAEAEFYGPNKARFVDPLVTIKGTLQRVSTVTPGLQYYFDEFADRYRSIGVTTL